MITIVGAGMAGLLAANTLHAKTRVVESQNDLPNNHSAVLRFRSNSIGDILGIPFKRVKMTKGYLPWKNPIADSLAYSYKTVGEYRSDRSIISTGIETHERFIAPENLIELMAQRIDKINYRHFHNFKGNDSPTISTIPMPHLMKQLDYPVKDIEFKNSHGFNLIVRLHNTDAYTSLYLPNPEHPVNRVSITGNLLIAEYSYPKETLHEVQRIMDNGDPEQEAKGVAAMLGIRPPFASFPMFKLQRFSKIVPIDNDVRKAFIAWATDQYQIYSFGRYATWRPGLLLDDLIQDIRYIGRWLNEENNYSVRLHRGG
jgi:hypothetical protein